MKKIQNNKTIIFLVILIILVIVGLYLKYNKSNVSTPFTDDVEQTEEAVDLVSIGSKEIKEKNFTGKVATVTGKSELARNSQAYIDRTVQEFKKRADIEVPDMLEEFGADAASAQYEISIEAKSVKSEKSESVAMLVYEYTGGAHGNSLYKVITTSPSGDKILSLSDVIKKDKQSAFTELVKKGLIAWRPYETTDVVVFAEEVQGLKFDSFVNWSMEDSQNDKNLTLYFAQYEIGPGVLGPVAFPVSIEKIKDFLN